MKFDHIGIATTTLAQGRYLFEKALGVEAWTAPICDEVNDIWAQFGRCPAKICYELVAPLSPRSPISSVLSKKINVLNHIAYLVGDLTLGAERLAGAGFVAVGPARPAIAYGGSPIQFFVAPNRLLIELVEAIDHQHDFVCDAA
jgi:methylmalonyl-CoA/ethylmalonyl-CoA epimerase